MGDVTPLFPEGQFDDVVILGLDPGGTTGWGVLSFPRATFWNSDAILTECMDWECGEIEGSEDEMADEVLGLIEEWEPDVQAWERFSLLRLDAELSPVRIMAKLQFAKYMDPDQYGANDDVLYFSPSDAMSTCSDLRLKRWEMWPKGMEHGRDGLRQAMMAARALKTNLALRDKYLMRRANGRRVEADSE